MNVTTIHVACGEEVCNSAPIRWDGERVVGGCQLKRLLKDSTKI